MTLSTQKARANQFCELHHGPSPLLLPNAWDAASACILAQAGFKAIATTSSGVAASLGYPDGQRISREMIIEVVERMTRVITCPLSVDLEAGYGENIAEVLQTVKAIIAAGAVGINIEEFHKTAGTITRGCFISSRTPHSHSRYGVIVGYAAGDQCAHRRIFIASRCLRRF